MTAPVTSPDAPTFASASVPATGTSPLPSGEGQGEGRPLLTEHFTTIASAPNGIKKLRELILELAVRGKLVPQDPSDEPANSLLKRIDEERNRLLAEGAIKNQKPIAEVSEAERQVDLPKGWAWTRLGGVVIESGAGWSPNCESGPRKGDEWGVLKVSAVSWGVFRPEENKALPLTLVARPELEVVTGDFLVSRANTAELVARSVVVQSPPKRLMLSDKIVRLKLSKLCDCRFINLANSSPRARDYYSQVAGGTSSSMKNVSREQILHLPVPFPPLAEQSRIVAKVDELMALCDQLEAQQADAETAHEKLVRELLATLTQSQSAADFQSNWQRLATHFDTLFTTEASIDALENVVRQLAIVGKLAPQDVNEEPADRLIERIIALKERLFAEGKIRVGKSRSEVESGRCAGDLPFGWVQSTVGDVTICRDGERIPISQSERDGREKIYDYYGASGVIDKIDGFLFDKPLLLIGEDGANLINRSTPIAFIARGQYWVNNHAHVLDGISEDLLKYVELYFNAIDLKPYVTGTAQPKMNQAKMNGIPIALPPEIEQKRIVSKVHDLMAICGRLRLQLARTRGLSEQLANALVEQVLV